MRFETKTRDNMEQSVVMVAALAGGSLKDETLDVATRLSVRIPATPFFLLKNWYGHGRTGRTGGAGPG